MNVGLGVGKLSRSLYIEGAAGGKGEGEGAEDDAHHLGHCWSAGRQYDVQLQLELGSGFKESFVHGTKSCHLGHLLYAGQILWLSRVDQKDSKTETEVDDGSHEGEVKEEANHIVLFHFPSAKVDYELKDLEEER